MLIPWKLDDKSLLKTDGGGWKKNKTLTTIPNFLTT